MVRNARFRPPGKGDTGAVALPVSPLWRRHPEAHASASRNLANAPSRTAALTCSGVWSCRDRTCSVVATEARCLPPSATFAVSMATWRPGRHVRRPSTAVDRAGSTASRAVRHEAATSARARFLRCWRRSQLTTGRDEPGTSDSRSGRKPGAPGTRSTAGPVLRWPSLARLAAASADASAFAFAAATAFVSRVRCVHRRVMPGLHHNAPAVATSHCRRSSHHHVVD